MRLGWNPTPRPLVILKMRIEVRVKKIFLKVCVSETDVTASGNRFLYFTSLFAKLLHFLPVISPCWVSLSEGSFLLILIRTRIIEWLEK